MEKLQVKLVRVTQMKKKKEMEYSIYSDHLHFEIRKIGYRNFSENYSSLEFHFSSKQLWNEIHHSY
ncbi:Protein CBG26859 [Caenorhabditis briggsae]|uniref:Protein CBG26859 n=1 Tax=Caenorhabditis briggsae TaxID=6238 RepID=B6II60_CAEBR|nr:Protein CBG26859 [Caenorhabditis briggsae]CAR99590.1 Protein CBG26859 [Caenorhabditis briggsae]